MHNMSNENAEHGKFLRQFLSLLGSRRQLILNGGRSLQSDTRQTEKTSEISAHFHYNSVHYVYFIL